MIAAPLAGWVFMTSNSSSVSAVGLRMIRSSTPIFPTSWSSAARRTLLDVLGRQAQLFARSPRRSARRAPSGRGCTGPSRRSPGRARGSTKGRARGSRGRPAGPCSKASRIDSAHPVEARRKGRDLRRSSDLDRGAVGALADGAGRSRELRDRPREPAGEHDAEQEGAGQGHRAPEQRCRAPSGRPRRRRGRGRARGARPSPARRPARWRRAPAPRRVSSDRVTRAGNRVKSDDERRRVAVDLRRLRKRKEDRSLPVDERRPHLAALPRRGTPAGSVSQDTRASTTPRRSPARVDDGHREHGHRPERRQQEGLPE